MEGAPQASRKSPCPEAAQEPPVRRCFEQGVCQEQRPKRPKVSLRGRLSAQIGTVTDVVRVRQGASKATAQASPANREGHCPTSATSPASPLHQRVPSAPEQVSHGVFTPWQCGPAGAVASPGAAAAATPPRPRNNNATAAPALKSKLQQAYTPQGGRSGKRQRSRSALAGDAEHGCTEMRVGTSIACATSQQEAAGPTRRRAGRRATKEADAAVGQEPSGAAPTLADSRTGVSTAAPRMFGQDYC